MKNAKEQDFIEWEDRETALKLFGRVRSVLEKSVIVDVIGIDFATVVSHKCYRIVEEAEIDAAAGERFQTASRKMGRRKWF